MVNIELKGLKGLRGLNELTKNYNEEQLKQEKIEMLQLHCLIPGKYQPRKNIDNNILSELANSIKTQGIIQPLIVRKINEGKYEIIAGERRWRAAQIVKLTHVPVIIKVINDNLALAFALIENIQRENLNSIEEVLAFARFRDDFSMTHDEIAHTVGKARVSITNSLRLLLLHPRVIELLEKNKLDMGHARALLGLPTDKQVEIVTLIVSKNSTVRETERLVQNYNNPHSSKETNLTEYAISSDLAGKIKFFQKNLSKKISSPVKIDVSKKGQGKLVINFDSVKEIEWFIEYFKIDLI